MKSKTIRISIGSIIFTNFLLSISLPAQGPRQMLEQPRLSKPSPQAIDAEIARIQEAVGKLRRLKIIIPIVFAGAGAAVIVTALGIAVGSVLLLAFRKNLSNAIKKIRGAIDEVLTKLKEKIPTAENKPEAELLLKLIEDLEIPKYKIISKLNEIYEVGQWIVKFQGSEIFNISEFAKKFKDSELPPRRRILYLSSMLKKKKDNAIKELRSWLEQLSIENLKQQKKFKVYHPKAFLALGTSGLVGGLAVALVTAFGTVAGVIATAVGIKKRQISRALDGAYLLKRIERQNPGTLTAKQKAAIAQLKKLSKDKMIRSYMKGLRMKEAMTAVVDAIMKQNPKLVATLGTEKRARKTLANYINLKWQAGNLQELTGQEQEHRNLMKGLTPEWEESYKKAKVELMKIKKKITKLEGKHSRLKDLPPEVIRDYKTSIEPILKEFEVAVKPKKEPGLPVIPL